MSVSSVLAKPSISSRFLGPFGILGIVAGSHAMTHIYVALMPLIYPLVMKEFGFNYSQLGLLIGIGTLVGGLMQLAFGYLGRFVLRKTILAAQNVALFLCMGVMAMTAGYLPFLGTNLGVRLATSPQHPVGNSMVADMFGKKLRGSAMAVNFAGGNAGAVVVPLIATFLILSVGWRWTLAIFAIPSILIAIFFTLFIREERPTDVSGARATGNPIREALDLLSNRTVLLVFIASSVAAGGRGVSVIMNYVPLYLRNGLGLDATYVGWVFTVLMIGSVVGPVIAGRISDKYGRRIVLMVAYILATISTSWLTLMTGQSWLLPVVILVIGLASYAESPLLQTFVADAARRGTRDLAFGLYFAIVQVAGSIWASLLGYFVDTQGFAFTFHVMAVSYIVAALLIFRASEQTDLEAEHY